MPILNHLGEPVTPDQIISENFNKNRRKKIMAASDMDLTMFANDLGTLVFLEKLADPLFWKFNTSEFSRLLLPKKYRKLLEEGAVGEIEELDPFLCRLALVLVNDIILLYQGIQKIETANGNGQNGEQALINEFARKMLELDHIFVKIDSTLAEKMQGEILMRTRFFAGKHPGAIGRLTEKVLKVSKTSVDRYLLLGIAEENQKKANQMVTEEMLMHLHGGKSPYQKIDRYVKIIDDVRETAAATVGFGIPTIVATGNLKAIATTAVAKTGYAFMQDQNFRRKHSGKETPPLVVGTWLQDGENGTLHTRVDGKAVLGDYKAKKVKEVAGRLNREPGIALGDSRSDVRMMQDALNEGGIVIIVGKTIEEIRKKFHGAFNGTSPETNPKIYCSVKDLQKPQKEVL